MNTRPHKSLAVKFFAVMTAMLSLCFSCLIGGNVHAAPDKNCPAIGWTETVRSYSRPTATFPTSDTRNDTPQNPLGHCAFHQWSWEAFAWATTMVTVSGTTAPRFLFLPTPQDLLGRGNDAAQMHPRTLRLATRSQLLRSNANFSEGAGAIVEADGNMLVAQNGYPVYASVHMNPTYFDTAKNNMIATGGYTKQDPSSNFSLGAAVFKATWLRIDAEKDAPKGAYVTDAAVPVLTAKVLTPGIVTIMPSGQYKTVKVALIGLHVVGYTEHHAEMLWGTFEHNLNSPATADNTFNPSKQTSDPNNYTLYKAGTTFDQVNKAAIPPVLNLKSDGQLTPVTNAVLENKTGGETTESGADDIVAINGQAQTTIAGVKGQEPFASYNLIGTVWLPADSYDTKSAASDAKGSINLANTTAETFFQAATNLPPAKVRNCFTCHNARSYSFQPEPPKKLPERLIASSHVLSYGSEYEVPNSISGPLALRPQD